MFRDDEKLPRISASRWDIGLFKLFSFRDADPAVISREYTLEYSLNSGEIISALRYLQVWEDLIQEECRLRFVPPVQAGIRLEGHFRCVGGLQSAFRSFCVINHGPEAVMCVSRMVLSGAKAHQRRAGREERCDDREAPDGAKRNRHAPGGSCEAAGEDRMARRADPALDAKKPRLISASAFSGEGGIRTREPLWEVTRFPDAPLQPLEHLSLRFAGANINKKC